MIKQNSLEHVFVLQKHNKRITDLSR